LISKVLNIFEALCQEVEKEFPDWTKVLRQKQYHYLAFLEYPEEVRKHIYSTNPVESLNAGLERMCLELGGYFPSLESLEVNIFIQVVNLQDKWWRRAMPSIQSVSYLIQQKFALTYELQEAY
jgi:transposase-like protein